MMAMCSRMLMAMRSPRRPLMQQSWLGGSERASERELPITPTYRWSRARRPPPRSGAPAASRLSGVPGVQEHPRGSYTPAGSCGPGWSQQEGAACAHLPLAAPLSSAPVPAPSGASGSGPLGPPRAHSLASPPAAPRSRVGPSAPAPGPAAPRQDPRPARQLPRRIPGAGTRSVASRTPARRPGTCLGAANRCARLAGGGRRRQRRSGAERSGVGEPGGTRAGGRQAGSGGGRGWGAHGLARAPRSGPRAHARPPRGPRPGAHSRPDNFAHDRAPRGGRVARGSPTPPGRGRPGPQFTRAPGGSRGSTPAGCHSDAPFSPVPRPVPRRARGGGGGGTAGGA